MKLVPAIFAIAALASINATALTIRDPETEIGSALVELDNLANRIETSAQMSVRQGLGPQNVAARNAYTNALKFFQHQEWLSVIREINSFLNISQVTDQQEYLHAQYMLGRSYEAMRLPSRSLRAYFRYIAAYLTSPRRNEDELIEVLRRIVPLATQDDDSGRQVREILSSITSLDLPQQIRPEVLFIAAKSAAQANQRNLASLWLEQSINSTNDSRLKAKALYIKALLAIAVRDFDKAEETLSEVIQIDDGKNGPDGYNNRDIARLALARIAVRKKRYDAAINYYGLIPHDSSAFKDALFESIYVHLGRKQDYEARAKALLFVGQFPDASESLQLRTLLAYLDLKTGDLDAAGSSIATSEQQLQSIGQWIKSNLSGIASIDQDKLLNFIAISQNQIKITPTVEAGQKLFSRLAEATRRLADIEGELRDTVYTLGRANLEQLKPRWANRAEQIANLADEALAIGHRLAAAERHVYTNRLSAVEIQQLQASEARRTNLLTPAAATKRKAQDWQDLVNFFDLTSDIANEHRKLHASRADLAAARYLVDYTNKKELTTARQKRLSELEEKLSRATNATATTLVRLRKAKLEQVVRQSPHHIANKFLAQYATALHEESGILQAIRKAPSSTSDKLLAQEATKSWKRWQYVIDRLFEDFATLDQEIRSNMRKILQEIEKHEDSHQQLSEKITTVRLELERRMGSSLSIIINNYSATIDSRQSRHRKWAADIEWLRYNETEKAAKRSQDQFDLETQVLRDNLTDLQQGVLWKWPD